MTSKSANRHSRTAGAWLLFRKANQVSRTLTGCASSGRVNVQRDAAVILHGTTEEVLILTALTQGGEDHWCSRYTG